MAKEELPVDKGWAWAICGAVFIMTFLLSAAGQVLSVTLLDLVEKFDTTLTTVSFLLMVQILSTSVFSIISANFLVPKFGIRKVCFVTTCIYSLAGIGFSASPSIYLCIALNGIKGMCAGCFVIPAISILGFYFNKYRSIATSLSMCGICCGSIAYPPFIRFMLTKFGLQGTFLVSAGIESHIIVASMLIRPVNSYCLPKPADAPPKDSQTEEDETLEIKPKEDSINDSDAKEALISHETNKEEQDNQKDIRVIYKNKSMNMNNGERSPKASLKRFKSVDGPTDETSSLKDMYRQNQTVSLKNGDEPFIQRRVPLPLALTQRPSLWSLPSNPSTIGIPQDTNMEDEESLSTKKTCYYRVNEIFDLTLFKNWTFIWTLLLALPSGSNQLIFVYLPTIGIYKGVSKDDSALLLTIMGSVDLVSRLLVGLLADTKLLRISTILGIASVCLGVVCVFIELYKGFTDMIIMCVFLGLFVGIRMSLGTVMFIDIVGLQKMAKAFSIYAMVLTLSGAVHNPLLGQLMEKEGVSIVMYYLSTVFVIGGLMFFFIPVMKRVEAKCKHLEHEETKLDP